MILTVTANASIDKRYVMTSMECGEVNRVSECEMSAGGKGLNVAHAVHAAGEEVMATGFLGGHHGQFIRERLVEEGIGEDFVWCKGETRSCINIWNEEKKEQTELLEPGLTVTSEDISNLISKFRDLAKKADVIAISGSLPKGADASLYRQMSAVAKSLEKKVILDTSGKTLIECVNLTEDASELPYMIKPNIDEIRQLTGIPVDSSNHEDIFSAALSLREKGIEVVVVSLGSEGSLMVCPDGCFEISVPVIDAVNTVGCGDALTGGFAVGLMKGFSFEECIRFASSVSTASAMTEKTGFFFLEDMKKIYKKVEVKRIKEL